MVDGLSPRGVGFFGRCRRDDRSAVPIAPDALTGDVRELIEKQALESTIAQMRVFDRAFSGWVIDSAGGVLEGALALGCSVGHKGGYLPPMLRRGDTGEVYFRMGSHDTAQCAIVMSSDGAVGALWSREFQQLFDSPQHLVEDSALWSELAGWRYVAVLESDPAVVLEWFGPLSLDAAASGQVASWWMGDGLAVVAHPYLTPQSRPRRQVHVLASDDGSHRSARILLEDRGEGRRCRLAEEFWGVVGEG